MAEARTHLVTRSPLELLLESDQSGGTQHHNDTVSNVSKHDSEEEGEGDDRKESRIDLLIRRNTVRVDDGLESGGKLVRRVESRWILERSALV